MQELVVFARSSHCGATENVFRTAESTHRLESNMWFYAVDRMAALFLPSSFAVNDDTR